MRCRAAARPSPRAQLHCLTLTALLLPGACTRPAAVARYAASAREVTARMPAAASALAASCRRTQAYRQQRSGAPWSDDDSTRTACAGRDSALRAVTGVNQILAAYLGALAALAGSSMTAVGARVDDLGDAAGRAGPFDASQVGAVSALAKFAASQAAGGYRRSALRDAIANENANVQAVTTALRDIIDRDYASYLQGDDAAATRFYRSALTESASREPLAAILVRNDYETRRAATGTQADAMRVLGRAMETIARGHQRLFDARDRLGAKEVLDGIVAAARELDGAIAKIDSAF